MKKSTILSIAASAAFITGSVFAAASVSSRNFKLTLPKKDAAAMANIMPKATTQTQQSSAPKIGSAPAGNAVANASISYIGSPSGASGSPRRGVDGRVKNALDMGGVKYTVDEDGDFKVHWTLEGGRTHMTFVNSQTTDYSGMELREVWAIGFVADSIDPNNLQALLELNATYKLGAWEIQKKNDGKYWAVFSIKVAADASGDVLRLATSAAASVADGIEASATRGDRF